MARFACITTSDDFLRHVDGFLLELVRLGHDVHVLTRLGPRARSLGARSPGAPVQVTLHDIPLTRRVTPLEDGLALLRMIRALSAISPDAVHVHNPKGALVGLAAARICGVKARIYTVHGLPLVTATGSRRRLLATAEEICCRLSTRVSCVSQSVLQRLTEEGLVDPKKAIVVGNGSAQGVDTAAFDPADWVDKGQQFRRKYHIPEGVPLLLFIGRLERDKGLEYLARTFTLLRGSEPEARLAVVGAADPVSPAALAGLDRMRGVSLCGPLDDPRPAYAAADVMFLPSRREGFPTVVLEAAAMQVPTVAFDVLGCVDAVAEGVNGILIAEGDDRAAAQALHSLMSDTGRRHALGRRAREWVVAGYSRPAVIRQQVSVYERWGLLPPSGAPA